VAAAVLASSGCVAVDRSGVRFDRRGDPAAVNCGTWISAVRVSDAETGRAVWAVEVSRRGTRQEDDVGEVSLGVLPRPGWRQITPYSPTPRPRRWRFDVESGFGRATFTVPDDGAHDVVYLEHGTESPEHFQNVTCAGPAASFASFVTSGHLLIARSVVLCGVLALALLLARRGRPEPASAGAGTGPQAHPRSAHGGWQISPGPPMSVPPAWYPDPWLPGRWSWWDGSQWFRPPAPSQLAVDWVGAWEAARLGLAELRARPRTYASVGGFLLASIAGSFTAATYGNGWAFGYGYFSDAAPSDLAHTVAVISSVVLAVLVGCLCAWSFGALAALGLGETSLAAAYRRSGRRLLPDGVLALPGLGIAVLAAMSVVLGPFVIGPLATFAVCRVAGNPPGAAVPRLGRGIRLGLIPTAVAVLVWITGAIAAAFPSPPTWLSAVFFVALVSASAFSMSWLATANAAIVIRESAAVGAVTSN
jgi:hypothetical protein